MLLPSGSSSMGSCMSALTPKLSPSARDDYEDKTLREGGHYTSYQVLAVVASPNPSLLNVAVISGVSIRGGEGGVKLVGVDLCDEDVVMTERFAERFWKAHNGRLSTVMGQDAASRADVSFEIGFSLHGAHALATGPSATLAVILAMILAARFPRCVICRLARGSDRGPGPAG